MKSDMTIEWAVFEDGPFEAEFDLLKAHGPWGERMPRWLRWVLRALGFRRFFGHRFMRASYTQDTTFVDLRAAVDIR